MKNLLLTLCCLTLALTLSAQESESLPAGGSAMSVRAQARFSTPQRQPEEAPWSRIIYRQLDLTKEKNMALFYPEEVIDGQENLFRLTMRLICDGTLPSYEYLDGKEIYTPQYRLKVKEMLERFHITHVDKKGSTAKNPKYVVEESDLPAGEVLTYYIKERWLFNAQNSRVEAYIEAICPVLHRSGDFGGEAMRYPMFWVKYDDLRPYLNQQRVMTSNENNSLRYSINDYFTLRMYDGEIFKTGNMRNQSLVQQFPNDTALKAARERIELQLANADSSLWVKPPKPVVKPEKSTTNAEGTTTVSTEKKEAEGRPAIRPEKAQKEAKAPKTKVSRSSSRPSAPASPVRSVRRTR